MQILRYSRSQSDRYLAGKLLNFKVTNKTLKYLKFCKYHTKENGYKEQQLFVLETSFRMINGKIQKENSKKEKLLTLCPCANMHFLLTILSDDFLTMKNDTIWIFMGNGKCNELSVSFKVPNVSDRKRNSKRKVERAARWSFVCVLLIISMGNLYVLI